MNCANIPQYVNILKSQAGTIRKVNANNQPIDLMALILIATVQCRKPFRAPAFTESHGPKSQACTVQSINPGLRCHCHATTITTAITAVKRFTSGHQLGRNGHGAGSNHLDSRW